MKNNEQRKKKPIKKKLARNKPNIPINVSCFETALALAGSNHSRICRALKDAKSKNAISYVTLTRNLKLSEMDPDTLHDICKLIDVHPGYITKENDYDNLWSASRFNDFMQSETGKLFSESAHVYLSRIDENGIIIAHFIDWVDPEPIRRFSDAGFQLVNAYMDAAGFRERFDAIKVEDKARIIDKSIQEIWKMLNELMDSDFCYYLFELDEDS